MPNENNPPTPRNPTGWMPAIIVGIVLLFVQVALFWTLRTEDRQQWTWADSTVKIIWKHDKLWATASRIESSCAVPDSIRVNDAWQKNTEGLVVCEWPWKEGPGFPPDSVPDPKGLGG